MKGVQCYELFGGIALKNHAFSFFFISITATFYFHQQSFQVIRMSLTLTSGKINFFYIYRPPQGRNNQLTDSSFVHVVCVADGSANVHVVLNVMIVVAGCT